MSKYRELKATPPYIYEKKLRNKKEIIFTLVSCMCDNIAYLRLKKNADGEFKIHTYNAHYNAAFSNFQFKYREHEIEWAADENNWGDVISMINSGTSVISEVISR